MEIEKKYTCCFVGHKMTDVTEELAKKTREIVEKLIVEEKVNIFLFHCKGKFDVLCFKIVTELKEKYSDIRRIKTNVGFSFFGGGFDEYIMDSCFEDSFDPGRIFNKERLVYGGKSEKERVDMSGFCVACYDENYDCSEEMPCGFGECTTEVLMEYAKGMDIRIINVGK